MTLQLKKEDKEKSYEIDVCTFLRIEGWNLKEIQVPLAMRTPRKDISKFFKF